MVEMYDFLSTVLPDKGIYCISNSHPSGSAFRNKPCNTIAEMVSTAEHLDGLGNNVYFACATFTNESYQDTQGKMRFRTAENAHWAKSFWLDIDCGEDKAAKSKGYFNKKAAWEEVEKFADQISLPLPIAVSSGSGIHCYWALQETIDKKQWKPTADKLKALTNQASISLLADNSRTADIASLLRPVGTHNWKPENNGQLVELKLNSKPIPFAQFCQTIDKAYSRYCTASLQKTSNVIATISTHPETQENIAKVKSALAVLSPNCDYELWRDICFSIHATGWSCAKELAKSWSKGEYR